MYRGHLFTESMSGFGPLTVMICDQVFPFYFAMPTIYRISSLPLPMIDGMHFACSVKMNIMLGA